MNFQLHLRKRVQKTKLFCVSNLMIGLKKKMANLTYITQETKNYLADIFTTYYFYPSSQNKLTLTKRFQNFVDYYLKVEKITVPIKAGTKVGTVEILDNEGLIVREEDVTISYDIEKCNLWETFLENLMTIIKGKKINKV